MTTTHHVLSILTGLALAGCAAEVEDELPELEEGAATASATCGIGTRVASLRSPTGSTVDFCVFPDDLVGVGESGPLDARAYVETLPPDLCADDIHARLAPGQKVPQALVDACRDRSGATALTLTADAPEPDGLDGEGSFGEPPEPLSHYCGAGGDVEFDEERCSFMQAAAGYSGWWDSMWWCSTSPHSAAQRTASSQIGHWVQKLGVAVASCSGISQVTLRAKRYGDWKTYVDDSVSANYWKSWSLYSYWDYDMRYNGSSSSGWFRDTGYFGDFQWP